MDSSHSSDPAPPRSSGDTRYWSKPIPSPATGPASPASARPMRLSDWAARAGRYREEILYPPLFGPAYHRTFPIPEDIVSGLSKVSLHLHQLQRAVIECAPTKSRASWLYVTSGLSDAWGRDSTKLLAPAGLGCEFVLETRMPSPWVVVRLQQLMAFQILIHEGGFPDRKPLDDFDRVPLRAPVGPDPSALTWLMLAPPTGFPRKARMQTGFFHFHQVVGISEVEAVFAREQGGDELWKLLQVYGCFPVTDPARTSVLSGEK